MIRKATKEDASAVAKLMVTAMGDLANQFRGLDEKVGILELFEKFIKYKGNQYSCENIMVYVIDETPVGAINA